jgi:8-oxo-dGTP pyrophosphatase MutT (NUDIX family)
VREFREESGLGVRPLRLLHVPGTLFSPWTHANYTPLYYEVAAAGEPRVPPGEPLELAFMDPDQAMASGRMAGPEILALKRALSRNL